MARAAACDVGNGCHHAAVISESRSAHVQERLNGRLAAAWRELPHARPAVALAMAAVGRGGPGDLGQRIRDDILSIQSANGAKVFACMCNLVSLHYSGCCRRLQVDLSTLSAKDARLLQ